MYLDLPTPLSPIIKIFKVVKILSFSIFDVIHKNVKKTNNFHQQIFMNNT